jgi:hypothetical protein
VGIADSLAVGALGTADSLAVGAITLDALGGGAV